MEVRPKRRLIAAHESNSVDCDTVDNIFQGHKTQPVLRNHENHSDSADKMSILRAKNALLLTSGAESDDAVRCSLKR
jgi:hypothetical protein